MELITTSPELLVYQAEKLTIEILGGIRITGLDRLRVTLKVSCKELKTVFPLRYNLDLYNTDQVEKLIRRIGEHFEMELSVIRQLLMGLIESLEEYRVKQLENTSDTKVKPKELSEEEKKAAMSYLKQKNLLKKMMEDIGKSGVIGEENNRLLMYLVFTSRKLKNPLHIITLGRSGEGKTHLQEKVSELIPDEDKIEITSLSKNSLYYFEKNELDRKLILIEDLDGATEESLYAIRELQSKKRLSKTIAVKDNKGQLKTQTVMVEGRVVIAGTTTKETIYEDNSNRSILIHVDGSKDQDEAIMQYQRRKSSGEINQKEEQQIKELFKNIQRLLQPMNIKNPYAEHLKLPETVYNPRRAMNIYLSFIEAVTLLHQYQRKLNKQGELETTLEDIYWTNALLSEVLIRKSDDLSGAGRDFLECIRVYLKDKNTSTFTGREIKQALRINSSNLKRYIKELENTGYICIKEGSRYTGFQYRLISSEEYESIRTKVTASLNSLLQKISRSVGHK